MLVLHRKQLGEERRLAIGFRRLAQGSGWRQRDQRAAGGGLLRRRRLGAARRQPALPMNHVLYLPSPHSTVSIRDKHPLSTLVLARAVPLAETALKSLNRRVFSNYLSIVRSFGAVSIPQSTPGATRRSQKGASVTRIEQPAGVPDAAEVLKSIGDVAYEWRLDTDVLVWSGNAASVLGITDLGGIGSGRSFAQKVEAA